MVADKGGISEAQARQAVGVVPGYLKGRLPELLAGQVDAAIEGELSGLEDLTGCLEGQDFLYPLVEV